jgi:peptidoglycan/LPS O-acetylase OafA/YrhL
MVPVYLVGIVIATAATLYALHWQRAGEMVWLRGDIPSAPAAFGVWLLHTFALQAWVPLYSVRDLFNPPDWSVATEAFLYACFPLLMVAFARWIRTARAAICVAAVFLAAQAIFTTVIITYAFNRWGLGEHYQEARLVHYQMPLARLPDFVTGCVIGLLLDRFDFRPVTTRAGRNAVAAAAIAWIALFIQLDNIIGAKRGTQTYILLLNLKMHVAFMPAVAALLFVLSLGPTFLHPLLEHRWMQAIGLASYSIYIIHFPLAQPLLISSMTRDGLPPIWQPAGLWVATIALGLAIHHIIEVPARRAVLGRRARPPSRAPAS